MSNITRLSNTRAVINEQFDGEIPVRDDSVLGGEIRRLDGLLHEFQRDTGPNYKRLTEDLELRMRRA